MRWFCWPWWGTSSKFRAEMQTFFEGVETPIFYRLFGIPGFASGSDPRKGGGGGKGVPREVKWVIKMSHKKMAAQDGRTDFWIRYCGICCLWLDENIFFAFTIASCGFTFPTAVRLCSGNEPLGSVHTPQSSCWQVKWVCNPFFCLTQNYQRCRLSIFLRWWQSRSVWMDL